MDKPRDPRALDAMGLTVSDVLREVMIRVARDRELPFAANGALQPEEALMVRSSMLTGSVPRWPQNAFAECEVPFEKLAETRAVR